MDGAFIAGEARRRNRQRILRLLHFVGIVCMGILRRVAQRLTMGRDRFYRAGRCVHDRELRLAAFRLRPIAGIA
jgi:hypothetical protein